MRVAPPSTSVAHEVKERVLKKALALVAKRQVLFKNMNLYSLEQLSKLIQEINEQNVLTVTSTDIRETEDLAIQPVDNMMSMSELKLMQLPTQYTEDIQSVSSPRDNQESKKRHLTSTKHDRLSIVDLLEEAPSRDYITCFSTGKDEEDEEGREIEAYRVMKHHEYEERAKKQAEQKKKQPAPINLSQERVMFGYDSKVIKLEKMKERQSQSISQMASHLISIDYDSKAKRKNLLLLNDKPPSIISNKVNVTLKEAEEEREKEKKARRHYPKANTSVQTETPLSLIKVNPQSHKEHEEAIFIKEPGVKISIQEKQFSLTRGSPRGKLNRRLTRSEYLQIKSNEQIKNIFKYSNASIIDKIKVKPSQERTSTEYMKEEKSSISQKEAKKIRFLLHPSHSEGKRDKSKIQIHSLEGKADLMKQVKEKPYLFSTLEDSPPQKESMSSIDRYNLLYVKYKGNPPAEAEEQLILELQSQSKAFKQTKSNLLTLYTNKKTSIKRENRLVKRMN